MDILDPAAMSPLERFCLVLQERVDTLTDELNQTRMRSDRFFSIHPRIKITTPLAVVLSKKIEYTIMIPRNREMGTVLKELNRVTAELTGALRVTIRLLQSNVLFPYMFSVSFIAATPCFNHELMHAILERLEDKESEILTTMPAIYYNTLNVWSYDHIKDTHDRHV